RHVGLLCRRLSGVASELLPRRCDDTTIVPACTDPVDVAREVGRRLADARRLASAVESASTAARETAAMTWHPAAPAQAPPGRALTFAELAARFPGEGWGTAAHRQIELAVEA